MPSHNRLALWSLAAIMPAALFWTAAAFFTVVGDGYRPVVDAIAAIPPAGAWLLAILFVSPLASASLGTAGRMQASRRQQRGDFFGFIGVALGCILLPVAIFAFVGVQ